MYLKNLENIKIKDNDLLIIKNENLNNIEKNKKLINFISKLIVEENKKVGILNCNIRPQVILKSIINKQIEVNKLKNLSQQQCRINLYNINNLIKSNLYLNYTTYITTKEIKEKCIFFKYEKKRDFIIITNIRKIKYLTNETKEKFLKDLELLSHQLEITIMLII